MLPNNNPKSVIQAVKITLVDPVNNRIECVPKQGTMISIFLISFPPFFVWPQVGEYWMVRRTNNSWVLDSRIQNRNASAPLANELSPGTAYVHATSILLSNGETITGTTMGLAQMRNGEATVEHPITDDSHIHLTIQEDGDGEVGHVRIASRIPGESFTIKSSSPTDTSKVAFQISKPAT